MAMRAFNTTFVKRIIEGAIRDYAHAHPERAIPDVTARGIAKRAARDIYMEARKRGLPNPNEQHFADVRFSSRKRPRP